MLFFTLAIVPALPRVMRWMAWMLWFASVAQADPGSAWQVTVDPVRVVEKSMVGFGVEWEYEGDRPEWNVENEMWLRRWPEMVRRVDLMRPSILRVMHDARMYGAIRDGRFVADYDSPRLRALYQILDLARERQIPVVLGEWWLAPEIAGPLGGMAGDGWAEQAVVPFLRYLRERRGYTNIRWFNLMNEPSATTSFSEWKCAILHLHRSLKAAGLEGVIRIMGPDGPGDWDDWVSKTAADPDLQQAIGAYGYHLYAHLKDDKWLPSLVAGRLEGGELRVKREQVNRLDPAGFQKPFIMGEAGIDDGNVGDTQTHRERFEYGVWMADYAAQSIRAGQAGMIAWCLDDAMHAGGSHGRLGLKGWGFWNSLAGTEGYAAEEFDPRPAFYAWALVCRHFPAGSSSIACPASPDDSVRFAAAIRPDGGFSGMLVNEADRPRVVEIRFARKDLLKGEDLLEFRYQRNLLEGNSAAVFKPVTRHPVDGFEQGVRIEIAGPGVVFLSSSNPSPP